MKCSICNGNIVLIPSATQRAKMFGGDPQEFIKIFTTHAECLIKKRSAEAIQAMKNQTNKQDGG